ncbi:MAG: oxaloacetate decarboxylase (Na+ extruding) subunit alpha [Clostridiales bacterium]|jgi:acetyl-CoA carboxylase biotin carboxyl carrier protein|nr:oxaloacetate decarboxylase (Na+ extruding) subunit alpha [Clostridiales bacterium]MDN5281903.1 oxaloacetate decarboxylase (Na+ extruding) subunit alpha [Candidatus Ozemobacter sp.]
MPKVKSTTAKSSGSKEKVLDQVVEIIQFMGDNQLAEIELETSDLKMTLKKRSSHCHSQISQPVHMPMPLSSFSVEESVMPVRRKTEEKPAKEAAEPEIDYHKIISPMAGNFYRAPSPTSPPFINEGDTVSVGQTVCIVEAMKMMNEIKADKAGKVVKILIDNGNPVEKGENLFYIGE